MGGWEKGLRHLGRMEMKVFVIFKEQFRLPCHRFFFFLILSASSWPSSVLFSFLLDRDPFSTLFAFFKNSLPFRGVKKATRSRKMRIKKQVIGTLRKKKKLAARDKRRSEVH